MLLASFKFTTFRWRINFDFRSQSLDSQLLNSSDLKNKKIVMKPHQNIAGLNEIKQCN